MTKQSAYFTLLGLVHDQLPEDAVARCLAADMKFNVVTLQNVRRGTTHKLPILIEMVKLCLPDFSISPDILSVV
jgi:hypothetical protein